MRYLVVLNVVLLAVTASAAAQEVQPAETPAADSGAAETSDDAATTTRDIPRIIRRKGVKRPALPEQIDTAFVIPIQEQISPKLAHAIGRKIMRCRGRGAQIIIFDLNSPGGRLDAMEEIVSTIRDEADDIYTVAYVHPNAISAAAIISLACDEIILAPAGKIGDAMPIMPGPQGVQEIPEKERGKIESYMRAEMRSLAKMQGYNVLMCEAMVTITIEVWLVENVATGERKVVEASEWRRRVKDTPDAGDDANADAEWRYIRTVDGPMELVTMDAEEAYMYGFTEHIIDDMDALEAHFNITTPPQVLADNWSEELVDFLTSPAVASILFFLMLLFGYLETNTPGFGVFGAIAITCLVILTTSQFLVGLAQWWEIAALILGVILILVEIFVIPGFGVAGISGIALCIIALLAMVVPNAPTELPWPDSQVAWDFFRRGTLGLGLAFVAFLVAAGILSQYLPKMKILSKSRLLLAPSRPAASEPRADDAPIFRINVGDEGLAASALRPVGEVRFDGDLIDAISDSGMIDRGRRVRVIKREGNRLVVEEIDT
ncbi:MAG: hypothetical protein GVY16_06015 [Planctomycetes bacterium]|jgi:membrane-bound serine protease (ClpP class)|nr:hypothetical protein [Phycisphaerae bacterium]NBB95278.1 hypothetical protein [Planctomycetota bacterium]